MDCGQHLVTTLVCFVNAEGGFCMGLSSRGGGVMSYTRLGDMMSIGL